MTYDEEVSALLSAQAAGIGLCCGRGAKIATAIIRHKRRRRRFGSWAQQSLACSTTPEIIGDLDGIYFERLVDWLDE